MKKYLPYILISCDICLRYYHLRYRGDIAEVEWYVWDTTSSARSLLFIIAMFAGIKLETALQKSICFLYGFWLALDFGQQLLFNNYNEEFWQLILFLIITTIIISHEYRKSEQLA